MNDTTTDQPLPVGDAVKRPRGTRAPRAKLYLRLLWLVPGLALLALGYWAYQNVEDDGAVHTVALTTKPGMVGQASEALRLVNPGTPDLYLKVKMASGELRTFTHKDTPIGNGLRWSLEAPVRMRAIREIEVWDEDPVSDNFKDRVALADWSAEGQAYRIELVGEKYKPPGWAMPVMAIGGAVTLLALLRFVWDQVI